MKDKALWMDAYQMDQSDHARMRAGIEFTVEQVQYRNDDNDSLDPNRIKPKSPALWNQVRHKKAKVLKEARHFEVHPLGGGTDPYAAEFWDKRLKLFTHNAQNCIRETQDRVITGAFAGGSWGAEWVYDPVAGAVLQAIPPNRLQWHPSYQAPFDPLNPVVFVWDRMSPEQIATMSGWTNNKDVSPDEGPSEAAAASTDSDIVRFGTNGPLGQGRSTVKLTTVLKAYYRFEYEKVPDRMQPAQVKILEPDEQYLKCPTCGWVTPPQAVTGPLPPSDLCPQCLLQGIQSMAELQLAEEITPQVLRFREGQRMRITAPFAGRTFYDGPWWFESETNGFPVDMWSPYPHPTKRFPMSETDYFKSVVLSEIMTIRMGLEAMRRAKGIIVAPEDGLNDAFGNPFQFSAHQDIAYYTSEIPGGGLSFFEPPGLPAGYVPFLQSIQNVFAMNKGTGDIAMTPDKSRDIAYSSLALQVETGEVPVDDHIASFKTFWSRMMTRLAEILKSTDPPTMMVDVTGPDGNPMEMHARAIPGVDILVTAEPTISQEQAQTFQTFMTAASAPNPALMPVVADMVGLPPKYKDQLTQVAMMAQQQQAVAMAAQAAQPAEDGKKQKGVASGTGPGAQ